jgi:hypothetical protein
MSIYDMQGYQEQRVGGEAVIETVERDIRLALNIGTCAAGRTDAVRWLRYVRSRAFS